MTGGPPSVVISFLEVVTLVDASNSGFRLKPESVGVVRERVSLTGELCEASPVKDDWSLAVIDEIDDLLLGNEDVTLGLSLLTADGVVLSFSLLGASIIMSPVEAGDVILLLRPSTTSVVLSLSERSRVLLPVGIGDEVLSLSVSSRYVVLSLSGKYTGLSFLVVDTDVVG